MGGKLFAEEPAKNPRDLERVRESGREKKRRKNRVAEV